MKASKRLDKLMSDVWAVEAALDEAKRKKKRSVIWIVVYSVLIAAGFVAWHNSRLKVFGFFEYLGLIGCGMVAIVLVCIALMLFDKFYQMQSNSIGPVRTWGDEDLIWIFSILGTAISIVLPCGIIWILVESVTPLYEWLTTPVFGILKYRGVRFAGCIVALIPYILLLIRYFKNKKLIPKYTEVYAFLKEQEDLAFEESISEENDAKRRSWEKMKEQRRAAERRKASLNSDSNNEEGSV